jgi:hypothetical protein
VLTLELESGGKKLFDSEEEQKDGNDDNFQDIDIRTNTTKTRESMKAEFLHSMISPSSSSFRKYLRS